MDVKEYWEERAKNEPTSVTTNDFFLRELERNRLIQKLSELGCSQRHRVLDIGCGDGITLIEIFKKFSCDCFGIDYSQKMIDLARQNSKENGLNPQNFSVFDITNVNSFKTVNTYDFILSDRCLINIIEKKQQSDVLSNLVKFVDSGGYYIAIENFVEGNEKLNQIRKIFELPPIEIRWHNRYFYENEFLKTLQQEFSLVEKINFSSSYYFATRIIYSKMCQIEGKNPDYLHPIHKHSINLPDFGDISPIIMYVFKRKCD